MVKTGMGFTIRQFSAAVRPSIMVNSKVYVHLKNTKSCEEVIRFQLFFGIPNRKFIVVAVCTTIVVKWFWTGLHTFCMCVWFRFRTFKCLNFFAFLCFYNIGNYGIEIGKLNFKIVPMTDSSSMLSVCYNFCSE